MYRIDIRRRTQKVLDKLPDPDFQAVIKTIKDLAETPGPRGIEKVKSTGLWRVRQGDYRVVYGVDDREKLITVVRIGHRREVYRAL